MDPLLILVLSSWPWTNIGMENSEPHSSSPAKDDFGQISISSFSLSLPLSSPSFLNRCSLSSSSRESRGVERWSVLGGGVGGEVSYRSITREARNERKGGGAQLLKSKKQRGRKEKRKTKKRKKVRIMSHMRSAYSHFLTSCPPPAPNVEKHKRAPQPEAAMVYLGSTNMQLQSQTGMRPGLLIVQKRNFYFANFSFIDWAFFRPITMALISESVNTKFLAVA